MEKIDNVLEANEGISSNLNTTRGILRGLESLCTHLTHRMAPIDESGINPHTILSNIRDMIKIADESSRWAEDWSEKIKEILLDEE